MHPRTCCAPIVMILFGGALATGVAAAQPSPQREQRSGPTALLLSVAGVAIPAFWPTSSHHNATPVIAGFLVGPSLGHFYAGNKEQAMFGIVGRSAVAAVGYASAATEARSCTRDCLFAGIGPIVGAAAVVTLWAVIDVIMAPRSARRHNARLVPPVADSTRPAMQPRNATSVGARRCVAICRPR